MLIYNYFCKFVFIFLMQINLMQKSQNINLQSYKYNKVTNIIKKSNIIINQKNVRKSY